MYKNMFNTKALPIAMSMAFVSTSVVAVEVSNHAGAICNNATASDAVRVSHNYNGTLYTPTTVPIPPSNIKVTCPLVRKTTWTYGAVIYVNINQQSSNLTTCRAYSYRPENIIVSQTLTTLPGVGFKTLEFNLYGSGRSNSTSYYSVSCDIPATHSTINGIRLYEYSSSDQVMGSQQQSQQTKNNNVRISQ